MAGYKKSMSFLCLSYFSSAPWLRRIHTTVSWTTVMDLQTKEQAASKSEYMYKEKGQKRTSTSHGRWLCFPGQGKHLCYPCHINCFYLKVVSPVRFFSLHSRTWRYQLHPLPKKWLFFLWNIFKARAWEHAASNWFLSHFPFHPDTAVGQIFLKFSLSSCAPELRIFRAFP